MSYDGHSGCSSCGCCWLPVGAVVARAAVVGSLVAVGFPVVVAAAGFLVAGAIEAHAAVSELLLMLKLMLPMFLTC